MRRSAATFVTGGPVGKNRTIIHRALVLISEVGRRIVLIKCLAVTIARWGCVLCPFYGDELKDDRLQMDTLLILLTVTK